MFLSAIRESAIQSSGIEVKTPVNAIDNDLNTCSRTTGFSPSWLLVDFGTIKVKDSLRIYNIGNIDYIIYKTGKGSYTNVINFRKHKIL